MKSSSAACSNSATGGRRNGGRTWPTPRPARTRPAAIGRAAGAAASEARRAARARREAAGRPLVELHRLCGLAAHAALARGGYHRHGGEWRRAMTSDTQTATAANWADEKVPSQAEVDAVIRAA